MTTSSSCALLLLTAKEGVAARLAERLGKSVSTAATTAGIVAGSSLGARFLEETAHGAALAGQPLFDALLYVPVLDDASEALIHDIVEELRDLVDADACAAVVGRERLRMEGEERLMLVFPWRAHVKLGREKAQEYWHDVHGEIVKRSGSRMGYRQIHADDAASAALVHRLGFGIADYDAAVFSNAPSLDMLHARFSNLHVQTVALTDERNFIDHRRSTLQAFEPL